MTDKLNPNDPNLDPNKTNPNPNDPEPKEPEAKEPESKEPEQKPSEDKKYTDKEVDDIVKRKLAKWEKAKEKEIADAKAESEKLAKMNADQKKDYEMEKLQEENAKLKAEATRNELGKTASTMLKEHEIEATPDMLEFVVGKDAETTKANIDKFVGIIQSQIKAAEVKRATGTTPKSYGDNQGEPEMSEMDKRIAKYKTGGNNNG